MSFYFLLQCFKGAKKTRNETEFESYNYNNKYLLDKKIKYKQKRKKWFFLNETYM